MVSIKDILIITFIVGAGILIERRLHTVQSFVENAISTHNKSYQQLLEKYNELEKLHREANAKADKDDDTRILDFDAVAQALCTASAKSHWVFAVPRDCSAKTTCNTLCTNAAGDMNKLIDNQASRFACVASFHLYKPAPKYRASTGKPVMGIFKYPHPCQETFCGPNYCCCLGT